MITEVVINNLHGSRLLSSSSCLLFFFFFFQAEDGIRDLTVTGVQTCALPIFNTTYYILEADRSGSAVVRVTRPIRLENVVRRVVQSAEAQRRARVIAFGGMVEHDVENDLEARSVQRLDHIAKLVDGTERIST